MAPARSLLAPLVADLVIKVGKAQPRSVRQGVQIVKGTASLRPAAKTLTTTITLPKRGRIVVLATDQVAQISRLVVLRSR